MKLKLSEPGIAVSGGIHLLALILLLVSFASKPEPLDPMQETVPIETVSDTEFNEVMKGEKTAAEVKPDAATTAQSAPTPEVSQTPPTPEPQQQTPPPPPPLPPEPVKQDVPTPPEPPPPQQATVLPPERPVEPPPPTPPARPIQQPTPTPPQRVDLDAEPIEAKPVPTPPRPPQRVAEVKPQPPVKPKPVQKPVPKPPKPDQLAQLIQDTPDEPDDKPAQKPVPKPRPAKLAKPAPDTTAEDRPFDITDITRLLTGSSSPQKSSDSRPSQVASLGSATAHAAKMAPSLWGQLDGLMEEQYRQCWSYLGLNAGQKYVPQIRVTYDESGGLSSDPVLVNPPSDPTLRSLAESAMRAVRRCNPLRIPSQYMPYYEEWKGRVLRFDPEEMAG